MPLMSKSGVDRGADTCSASLGHYREAAPNANIAHALMVVAMVVSPWQLTGHLRNLVMQHAAADCVGGINNEASGLGLLIFLRLWFSRASQY